MIAVERDCTLRNIQGARWGVAFGFSDAIRCRRLASVAIASFVILFSAPHAARSQASASSFDVARFKGKVVYLDFWASWCGPCKLSFPYMHKLAAAHPNDGFVVVAVDVDRSREKADAFLMGMKNQLPIVYDPDAKLARAFKITGMPTTLLIGRDGRVRYIHEGFSPSKTPAYDAQIEELLHEKP